MGNCSGSGRNGLQESNQKPLGGASSGGDRIDYIREMRDKYAK